MLRQFSPAGSRLRDVDRERQFLHDAARAHDPFVEHANARLEPLSDSWLWIGIRRHLHELLKVTADLGAGAVLTDQSLRCEQGLSDIDRARVGAVLVVAARHAAQAQGSITAVLRALEHEASS
jgi:hypothetical protein